jgi:hypothetical protein
LVSVIKRGTLRVFENRVLRRRFGPKRDEVTGESRKLRNEELHYLYSSPSIIRIIKSRRMRWECSTNEGKNERMYVIGGNSRGKEATRKSKTDVGE